MYLYAGGDAVLEDSEIVGLFDIDKVTQSYLTREYLSKAEKNGLLKNAAEDIPKTFIVTDSDQVILAQPNTTVLVKRLENR